jgi:streptogramin lyase
VNSGEVAVTLLQGSAVGFSDAALSRGEILEVSDGQPANGALSPDGFWFACQAGGSGFLLRTTGGAEVDRIPVDYKPYGVASDGDFLFVTFADDDRLGKVDIRTQEVQTAEVGDLPVDVAVINGDLWVTLGNSDEVVVLDRDSLAVKGRYATGDEPWKLAFGLGSVWITNRSGSTPEEPGSVTRLDPETGERQQDDIRVGVKPDGLTVADQAVYVSNRGSDSISVLVSQSS